MMPIYTNKDLEKYNQRAIPQTQVPAQLQVATPQANALPQFNLANLDWNALAKLFQHPDATPAFYKTALGTLNELLSHQRQMEQLNIQRQQAEALAQNREVTPYMTLIGHLNNEIFKLYPALEQAKTSGNKMMEAMIATQIKDLMDKQEAVMSIVSEKMGIPLPKAQTNVPNTATSENTAPTNTGGFFEKLLKNIQTPILSEMEEKMLGNLGLPSEYTLYPYKR